MDAYAREHGGEEGGLVLAVAVAIAEDVGGGMGLEAADSLLDDEVADVFLDELGDGFGLEVEVGFAGGELGGFGGDVGSGDHAVAGEGVVPDADALPAVERGGGLAAVGPGGSVVDGHAAHETVDRRAEGDAIEVDGGGVGEVPAGALVFEVGGLDGVVMGPGDGVGEVGRELEGEALLEVGDVVLEEPVGLVDVGAGALLVLVGDDAAGVAAGGAGDADAHVLVEVAGAGVADVGDFVVFEGVLVAVGADAPDVEGEDFGVFIVGDADDGVFAAGGAEDLDDVAMVFDGLAVVGDGEDRSRRGGRRRGFRRSRRAATGRWRRAPSRGRSLSRRRRRG